MFSEYWRGGCGCCGDDLFPLTQYLQMTKIASIPATVASTAMAIVAACESLDGEEELLVRPPEPVAPSLL